MPLPDANTIVFSSPVYVSIFACWLVNEPCGLFQIAIICFTLIGVVLVSKPTFMFGADATSDNFRVEGLVMAFLAALGLALVIRSLENYRKLPLQSQFGGFQSQV